MKKLTSVLVAGAVLASTATAFAQDNPFAETKTAETKKVEATATPVTNTGATTPTVDDLKPTEIKTGENPFANKETTTTNAKEVEAKVTVESSKKDDKVTLTIEVDSEATKAKTAKFVVKFPDVVTITDKDVVKGDLFDKSEVKVEGNTFTFTADSVTAVPAKGKVLTATFSVKAGTAKQDYPFTVDSTASELTNELNETVKVKTTAQMVELATTTPVVEEAKKETGFAENVGLLGLLGVSGAAFVASRRKKSI